MTDEELLDLFGDELQDIIDNLDQGLPESIETLIMGIFSRIEFDTVVFGTRITQYVQSLLDQGLTESFLITQLESDMATGGRIFGELKNSIAAGIHELANQAGRVGQLEIFGSEFEEYMWITVAGHKICPDCDLRGGEIDTFDNWVERGLPGSGWSVCRGYCYCVLDPTGQLSKKVDAPDDIREPGTK